MSGYVRSSPAEPKTPAGDARSGAGAVAEIISDDPPEAELGSLPGADVIRGLDAEMQRRGGESTAGTEYQSLSAMWQHQLGDAINGGADGGQPQWYSKAFDYWNDEANCPPTVDGVLGGYGHVSGVDLGSSRMFLRDLRTALPHLGRADAVECGAGIGRVVKGLLLDHFEKVELVEQSPRLLEAAPGYLGPWARRCTFTCLGMQDYSPEAESLDLVWIQWAIGHLTDPDVVTFLGRMGAALREHGVLVLKENCAEEGFVVDSEDSSIIRTKEYFYRLFDAADWELVYEAQQECFPEELYPVFMFAIRSKIRATAGS
mmetsp:Transcript_24964/g.78167  ORF Transcript_24964/g.78167 Transcript_24964/m.78167 type:complete len:316 (-) Transcript_24964:1430-2377(-)